jgi:hypothetical protein
MKTFTNFFRTVALLGLALISIGTLKAQHFTAPTSSNGLGQWTLFISGAKVNGATLTAGDEVAVYDGSTCVGAVILTADATEANAFSNQMIAYEANGSGTIGYTPGHSFTFRCWDASASQEYISTSYVWTDPVGDGYETTVFPPTNTFNWSYPDVTFTQTSGTISLQGTVTQNYGTHDAISGAVVSIVDGSSVTYQAVTNSTGNYVFRDLASDTYSATVSKTGYKTTTAVSVVVNSGTIPVTQNFAMDQADGSIEGTVKDAAYAVMQGATVTVKNAALTTTYGTATTNASGEYTISVPPGTNYSVIASKTGYQDYTYTGVSVTSGAATYKHFVLTATPGNITGTVTDGTGAAVSGVDVAVSGTSLTATTDGSGQYTIHYVPVGTYSMTFTKDTYHDASVSGVTITATNHDVTQDATIYAKHYSFQSGDPFSNVWTVYLKTVTGDGAALKKDDEIGIYSPTSATNSSGSITAFAAKHGSDITAFAAKVDGAVSAFAFKSSGNVSSTAATTTGSITAFSQKSGSITAYADAGGGEVTVTDNSHGLVDGESITISGTTNYNGTFTITYVDANTFKITAAWNGDDATGSWTGDNTTVTSNAHGLSNGDQVTITGTTNYNGTYTILGVDANNFDIVKTFVANDATGTWVGNKTTVTTSAAHGLSNGNQVTINGTGSTDGVYTVSGVTGTTFDIVHTFTGSESGEWGTKTTVTSTAHGLSNGNSVTISGNASYNGTYTIEGVTANTFDIVKVFSGTGTGTWTGPASSTLTTVTADNTTGLSVGSTLTIAGTTNYDGTYTVSALTDATHFDIEKAFVADDATGTWVGDKTKVTSANNLNTNDVVTITGTTNYDGTYTVTGTVNGAGGSFLITKAYTSDDATGLWYNTDVSTMNLVGVYYLNGAINNSGFSNDLIAFSTLADGTTGYTAGLPFVFKLWIAGGSQVSDVHSISWTATGSGLTNPGIDFPSGNTYSQATIDFDVPPGSIDLTFTKNGTANPDSEIDYILKLNGTAVAGGSGTIAAGSNTATIANVDAGTYTLYAYGPRFEDTTYTNLQVYAGATTHKAYTINYAPGETQNITLHTGYQLISRRVGSENITTFDNTTIAGMSTFQSEGAFSQNNFMRDEGSHTYAYAGGAWVNSLTGDGVAHGWYITKGYIVYLDPNSTLTQFSISGTPINYNSDIAINGADNTMISYLPSYNLSASTAFASLKTDDLNYIRATDGSTLRKIGSTWVDNIGTCSPGEGFLINWSGSATTFNYPAQAKSASAVKSRTNVHYTLKGGDPTGNIFTMYVQGDALEPGDEVAAYDGDKLVGIGVIESSDWQNNDLPMFNRINDDQGYVPGDVITLKVWKASENKEYSVDFTAINTPDGDRSYTGDTYPEGDNKYEISDLKLSVTGIADQLAASISLYPNPADAQLKITAPQRIDHVQLVNLMGQKIFEGTPKATQFTLDVSSYLPGVYFLNLTIDGQPVTKKLSVR